MIVYPKRELALKIAFCFLGKPYIWGGDDPMRGFDCSGFILELLKSTGMYPRGVDCTADQLFKYLVAKGCPVNDNVPYSSWLVFWGVWAGDLDKKIHVEMCIDKYHSIGASGGGSKTLTVEDAIRDNAFIKVRPIDGRYGSRVFVDPFAVKE